MGATKISQAPAISAAHTVRVQAVTAVRAQPSPLASRGTLRASEMSVMIRTSVIADRWCVTTVAAESTMVSLLHAARSHLDGERTALTKATSAHTARVIAIDS